jgi:hypothetical protein
VACPNLTRCPLFAHFRVKASLSVWQTFYCEADYQRCERFQLGASGRPVPATLLPNGKHLQVAELAELEGSDEPA